MRWYIRRQWSGHRVLCFPSKWSNLLVFFHNGTSANKPSCCMRFCAEYRQCKQDFWPKLFITRCTLFPSSTRRNPMPTIQVIRARYVNQELCLIGKITIDFLWNFFCVFSAFINSLLSESTEVAINQLLTHLPLLRPSNVECKQCYLAAIPELVNQCSKSGLYIEQAQQLLGYTLIHPAITSQDRRSLTQWLRHIEERISSAPPIHSLEEYTNAPIR